ncbi:MAG TPA: Fe-S cluster assembly ATPase SufC [Clostridia bacterium]|nr:Fe-S cluster assembly ATPase SufC [Clostridia bacterium]
MANRSLISVRGLHAALETGEEILKGVDLNIKKGEVHVIMGPNGSGKSTLANAIMGSPVYRITEGRIEFEGEDITEAAADARAKRGIFMAFQAPEEIDGITVSDFLKTAKVAAGGKPLKFFDFSMQLEDSLRALQLDESYAGRYLNVGFSGGEKKKSEILQLLTLQPKLAILDETDSGLDVDAVRVVTDGILRYKNRNNALLIISHSTRLLDELPVDYVHILSRGKFVCTGDRKLIDEVNANGFARFAQAEAR